MLDFLDARKLLTNAGRRQLQMKDREDRLTLRPEHVKAHAHGFLEQLALGEVDLQSEWEAYRQTYDFRKPGKPTPYQRLLLEFSRDRTLDGLLQWFDRFPQLEARLEQVLPSAGPDRPRAELFLEARREGVGSTRWRSAPRLALSLLPHLKRRLSGPDCLAEADRLAQELPADPACLLDLARACNLGPEDTFAACTLEAEAASRLARAGDAVFARAEGRHPGACALRTVGDRCSLRLLLESEDESGRTLICYGPRPGRPVTAAVIGEAVEAIERRLDRE